MSPKGPIVVRHFCLYRRHSALTGLISGVGLALALALTTFAQVASAQIPAIVIVTVTPSVATVGSKGKVNFHATVTNSTNKNVTWSVNVGSISSTGVYTAPTVTTGTTALVTATSAADTTKKAVASVTVT